MRHQVKTNETQEDPTVHLASEHGEESVELHFVRRHGHLLENSPSSTFAGGDTTRGWHPASQFDQTNRSYFFFFFLSNPEKEILFCHP